MKKQVTKKDISHNFSLADFQFRKDFVLVTGIQTSSVDGLVSPKQADDKPIFGEVVSVGSDIQDIKVKDIILFGQYTTEQIRDKGTQYFFVHDEDVKGVLKRNEK